MWSSEEITVFNSIVLPIVNSTNFTDYPEENKPVEKYSYSRNGNPNRDALELKLTKLEEGNFGLCFASGMAAIVGLTNSFVEHGDHVICSNRIFLGTSRFLVNEGKRVRFDLSFVDCLNIDILKKALRPTTKLVILEVVSNPTLRIIDLQAVSNAVSSHPDVLLAVDNSFLSPFTVRPFDYGVDIVLHSVTKILNGHGDVTMGVVIMKREDLHKKLYYYQTYLGAVPSPFDCYLVNRSLKTLQIRNREHCSSALRIAMYLETHPAVERVIYPGLPNHPEHELAKRQLRDFGGIVSMFLRGALQEVRAFIRRLKIFTSSWGLGLADSIVYYPWNSYLLTPNDSIPENERPDDVTESFVRLWIGIEDWSLLIEDLKQSLDKFKLD